jgi:fimbrial chaperone protein
MLVIPMMSMAAGAQALSVLPVNIFVQPGQKAATLTVTNQGTSETAIQIRAFAWNQPDGADQLTTSDAVVVSPPLASIAAGATQVIRIILRQPPQGSESTYRILVDQIPPPAEPGVVHIVLRMSIPIFAQPLTRALPHVQFHVESDAGQLYLVGINDGLHHETIRNIELSTSGGRTLQADSSSTPYILAGVTRRWHIAVDGPLPLPSESLRLTAHSDAGSIEEQVAVVAKR